MDDEDKAFIIDEVGELLENNFQGFGLEEIIDCSEELSAAQIKWAKEHLKVVVVEENAYDRQDKQMQGMLDALVYLSTAIMPEERKYDEYGFCRIHHDILRDFDKRVRKGIVAGMGK